MSVALSFDPWSAVQVIKFFRLDLIVTAVGLVVAFLYGGVSVLAVTLILIVIEIVFSFDNAAVNAKYLERLNEFWQMMFLTVGVLIAVFGMRLVFPFVVVCVSGAITPMEAIDLALAKGDPHTPGTYGYVLNEAHAAIAAFGGIFLLMLFLDFVFDVERDSLWLAWIERPLQRAGRLETLSTIVALLVIVAAAEVLHPEESSRVLLAGLLGIATYLSVSGISQAMEQRERTFSYELGKSESALPLAGKAAFSLFVFLEVPDASFSFDGVIGAFAITPDPIVIAIGLGVGAMFVRSMTIYLVRKGTLAEYRYLEHGAHWAIGALAVLLILTLRWEIPDIAIGLVGLVFIVSAFVASSSANRRDLAEAMEH